MMKLSKGKFQAILILAIVLAAYLLLAFVIPFTKTAEIGRASCRERV